MPAAEPVPRLPEIATAAAPRSRAPRRLRVFSIRLKLTAMVLMFSGAIVGLLTIMNLSLDVASGVRAYVEGEGLWSKGQKDGVYWLLRYLRTQDDADFSRYEQALRKPLGDRVARLEMSRPQYDAGRVRQGFLDGGNAAEDVAPMINLFRGFGDTGWFAPSISVWGEADLYVLRLVDCGEEIRATVHAGKLTRERQDQLLARLDQINAKLTELENRFSADFGSGARNVQNVLTAVMIASTALLLCCGLLVSWWISRGILGAIRRLRDGALRVSAGDLDHQIVVRAQDELGELARIFNDMVRRRRQAEEALRGATEFRERVMQSATNAIYVIDVGGRFNLVNRRTCEITGYAEEELLGRSFLDLIAPEHHAKITANYRDVIGRGVSLHGEEAEIVCSDGSRVTIAYSSGPLYKDGRIFALVGTAEDITERKRTEAYIRHSAQHDALTGLPNRSLLLDRLDAAMHRARHGAGTVALLMIDLDHFKRINDSLGHQFGDQLLLRLSERLQHCIRPGDTVARLGGDEFVIILPNVGERDGVNAAIHEVIEGVTEAISTPVTIEGHELLVTPSIGGCIYPRDGEDAGTLLKHADVAMYQAKSAGRSNIQWFTPDMLRESADRLALGSALRRAMENDELRLHYQPEICLSTGRTIGMEALLRWNHPEFGNIAPSRFIPVAEETGQIIALGEWVLETACCEAAAIQARTGEPLILAVNVSPRQFQQQDWLKVVSGALQRSGLAPRHLELEITEGMLMRNPEESAALLHQLRALGVTVVIDDFGTGYSSLSYLTRFPIDKIKIDRSFVRDLGTDATDAAVINAIIAMARSLDIRVIAEGVETPAQQLYLRERGCHEAQGFYYSEAVPAERFMALAA